VWFTVADLEEADILGGNTVTDSKMIPDLTKWLIFAGIRVKVRAGGLYLQVDRYKHQSFITVLNKQLGIK